MTLLAIDGRRLLLGPCDLVDGTPVFDLKPYVAAVDAFPDARAGWIDLNVPDRAAQLAFLARWPLPAGAPAECGPASHEAGYIS